MTPLLKKPPATRVCNYRPISLTSSVCKVLETLVKDDILSHLTVNSLITSSQYGFLPGKSTLSQLISSVSDWVSSVNENEQTEVIYVDYAKAFDTVCHQKLLLKLKSYGMCGEVWKWLNSFLSSREFQVKVGEFFSNSREITSGDPQGSILGPLLFLIYINDVSDNLSSACRLYSDDLKIYRTLRDPPSDFYELQNDLSRLENWSNIWQLHISEEKCNLFHIRFQHECFLRLGNVKLPVRDIVKDLGVYVDSDFKWRFHCTEIAKKASRVANCILRSLQHPCLEHYKKAFVVYCRPLLEYCTPIWSPSAAEIIGIVENVQRRYTRIAFAKCFPSQTMPNYQQRLEKMGLKTLQYRRIEFDLYLCYKIVNGFSDIPFDNIFSFTKFRNRSRQHRFQLERALTTKTCVLRSFAFRVVQIWNNLPAKIVEARNFSVFKKRLSDFDLSTIKATDGHSFL